MTRLLLPASFIALFCLLLMPGCPGGISSEFFLNESTKEQPSADTNTPDAATQEQTPPDTPTQKDTANEPTQQPDEPSTPEEPSSTPEEPTSTPEESSSTPEEPVAEVAPEPQPEPTPEKEPPVNRCSQVKPPVATGQTLTLSPGQTLLSVLKQASDGDQIEVKQGTYPYEKITGITFKKHVIIKAAKGATVTFEGMDWQNCAYIAFEDIRIRKKTIGFRDCKNIWFYKVDIDLGTASQSGLAVVGSGKTTSCAELDVHHSRISGGQRTIFIRTNFNVDNVWCHNIRFSYNTLECGTNNCFQFSGVRDAQIHNNDIKTIGGGVGVLLAGATRIDIRRNTIKGDKSKKFGYGMNIATPGKEWDNFNNVKYMISSDVTVANNLITEWSGHGIALNGTKKIYIYNNTIFDNKYNSIQFVRRTPHDKAGNVILTGNTQISLWNNIMNKVVLASGESRPTLESNNLVKTSGGAGKNLIKADPMFVGGGDYSLMSGSPAIDKGLVNKDTPKLDLYNTPRDSKPDIGAMEAGSQPATCP
ncbi:MAG TPA: hypothetical protein DCE42_03705 [Myxococcales bacterium]|nr:hypothetical protein [Myxococcales bacterium]